jgi:hypothetical protein
MKFIDIPIFPTHIVRFDASEVFLKHEVEIMIDDIEKAIREKTLMQYDELTPKHQSKPFLFLDKGDKIWQKLQNNFISCCQNYLQIVGDFVQNQNDMEFTDARAWFYRNDGELNKVETNPWHNHNPSFLSGVFYLQVPGDGSSGGTEFHDPRSPECHQTRFVEITPMNLTWVIFPGWMYHKSNYPKNTSDYRYVIAADSYVRVK